MALSYRYLADTSKNHKHGSEKTYEFQGEKNVSKFAFFLTFSGI